MKKSMLLTGMLLCLALSAFSQHKTYFGGGVSVTNDQYELRDPGGGLRMGVLLNGTYGATIGQEIGKFFVLETGFIGKKYSEGFLFKGDYSNASSGSLHSWQFPFRLKSRLNLLQNKIFFTSTAGYVFAVNNAYYPDFPGGTNAMISYGTQTINNDTYAFYSATKTNFRRTFSLFQAGLGLDFLILKKVNLAFAASYFTGINKIMQMEIQYQQASGEKQYATITGKGNYWNYGLTASYPISELWQKQP